MKPASFDEFFASGLEETISPFLIPSSRKWGKNLPLKTALLSALCLVLSFVFSFHHEAISWLFLMGVYFLSGTPALIHALHDLKNWEINIDVLMTLAALLSVIIGSGFEGGLLLVLFELSGAMEELASQKTRGALQALHQLSPKMAWVIKEDRSVIAVSVKEIGTGTKLLIKAGEMVPLDGIVVEGSSFVDLSHLTGESQPVAKKAEDEVPAGAKNIDGTLTISVTRGSGDSTLAKIIELVTKAQEAKPKVQLFLDRFGKWYASTIILLSLGFALTLPLFGISFLGGEGSIYRALAFLIAASPCALIIATPTAYLSAISSCARRGVVLKGGITLDALAKCKTVAFDKTGTLTTGKLSCVSVQQLKGPSFDRNQAIAIAAALEQYAVHPIAEAIVAYSQDLKLKPLSVTHFQSIPGFGLEGDVDGMHAKIGRLSFIENVEKTSSSMLATYLQIGDVIFQFQFEDAIRPQAPLLIDELKAKKLSVVMLTGDHEASAASIAKALGIDAFYADLHPEHKLERVAELSHANGLIMVGDGMNDAPALARSTVGISMGKIGSATAVEASDIVFLNDDIAVLSWLHTKAFQTMAVVRQNLSLALGVIFLATTPALLGWVPLWAAVILHEGGTLLVGLNSLRLLRR